jgi:hypothetical protein
MFKEAVISFSLVLPPPEVSVPCSPYSFNWWEEEEVPVPSLECDIEEIFRLLIEDVNRRSWEP